MRKRAEVLVDWIEDLAQKLDRPADEIRQRGLSAYDFSPSRSVRIEFGDGSTAEFRYAFACIRPQAARVAVFTEHCGYLEFDLVPDMAVIELFERHYRHA